MLTRCIGGRVTVLLYDRHDAAGPLQIRTRAEIRERYGIRGDSCEDCTTSFCYPQFSLIQERREIELEEYSL
jgi:Cys-rich protein (TIGR01571 family)